MSIPLKWGDYALFREEVQDKCRYFRTDWATDFLEALKHTCKKRIVTITKNTELWRSRLGGVPAGRNDTSIQKYSCDKMTAPPPNKSRASRIGVTGIPVLYLSSDKDTAMSEVRPWKNQPVSLAKFHLIKDLNIVDCHQAGLDGTGSDLDKMFPRGNVIAEETISSSEHENSAWAWIEWSFSMPVLQSDESLAYLATQVIAELFKTEGYDGIKYRSSVASGYNIALFDVNAATAVGTELYYTHDICYKFSKDRIPR